MKLPLSWLKEYFPHKQTPEQIANELTLLGLEVDAIEYPEFNFEHVVVAKIVQTKPHPNADHLTIATVENGEGSLQVVCAAKNCRTGLVTALAGPNATLTDDKGKVVKIQKTKLRGVESFGMLCSLQELGLSSNSTGIAEFSDILPLGKNIRDLYQDPIFEISLTPNLGHCTSIIGIARELAATQNLSIDYPHITLNEQLPSTKVAVHIEEQQACHQYSYQIVKNISKRSTPSWIVDRIEACGIRSISLVVDILNYVLLETGQPMHAFDLDKIRHKSIRVAKNMDTIDFTTLDGQSRALPKDTLLIYDDQTPIAIAGIMGGDNSAIDENTTNIFLEAAHFTPSIVRKVSKQINLRTDSSSRFEKGIDEKAIEFALHRAASLIQACTKADVQPSISNRLFPYKKKILRIRLHKVNQLLGTCLSHNEILEVFTKLQIPTKKITEDEWQLEIPSYRNDLNLEIDLIEEVARIYGYNNIEKAPHKISVSQIPNYHFYDFENTLREHLVKLGYQEFITCSLISPKQSKIGLESNAMHQLIHVLHAKSVDQSVLRTTFLANLLDCVKRNQNFKQYNIQCFELGRLQFKNFDNFSERFALGILSCGSTHPMHWKEKPQKLNFYDMKGSLETLFAYLKIDNISFTASEMISFHPGQQATISYKEQKIGILAQVHPKLLKDLDIQGPVFYSELDMHVLYALAPKTYKMHPLPIYPESERDLTLTVKKNSSFAFLHQLINNAHIPYLQNFQLTDIYTNEKMQDTQNITLRFTYRNNEKTIEQKVVDTSHEKLVSLLQSKLS